MEKLLTILTVLILFAAQALPAAEVKNTEVRQAGNRGQFAYDLVGDEAEAEVEVILTIQGKEYKASDLHLEGDFVKVKPGRGKVIWWNILLDFPRGLDSEVAWSITAGGGRAFTDRVTGMEFIRVKGGCYEMGDTFGDGDADEKPVHEVCVNDFYMGKYEVTVRQFRRFVQDTGYRTEAEKGDGCFIWTGVKWETRAGTSWRSPELSQGEDHPVVCVSWNDALAFNAWLSRKSDKNYRLPTEAEWEYAARSGGKSEKYAGTSSDGDLGGYAWYDANSGRTTHPVGQKQPNVLGLYDMTGNIWEWCQDWYGEKYYAGSPRSNPQGPGNGTYRVLRGGAWDTNVRGVRAANRTRNNPSSRTSSSGCRLSLSGP